MKRLFISTTNTIDNGNAVAYYGVVSSHLVAGTGFLSDFVASFSDFFGGRSGSYRRQMESLYGDTSFARPAGLALGLGVSCFLASIPFSAIGRGKINAVVDNYNDNHHANISFGATNNGVGFAFNF